MTIIFDSLKETLNNVALFIEIGASGILPDEEVFSFDVIKLLE